jgi:hypothetical protein
MLDVSHMTELRSSGSGTKRQRQTPNLELRTREGGIHYRGAEGTKVGIEVRSQKSELRTSNPKLRNRRPVNGETVKGIHHRGAEDTKGRNEFKFGSVRVMVSAA